MHRAARWLQLGGRQRPFALSIACGGSAVAVYGANRDSKPLLADGGPFSAAWRSKPTVVPNATTQPQHGKTSESAGELSREPESTEQSTVADQPPPPQTQGQKLLDTKGILPDDPLQVWRYATDRLAAVSGSFSSFDITALREKMVGLLIPSWVRMLPDWIKKLQDELSMAPWSLSWEIWEEAHDPEINPEIIWDARVRVSKELCVEERAFLLKRRVQTAKALARYLGIPESDVHPEDVPIIGICGSGGGLRALVAGASSFLSAAEDGLFDCATYTAGVSGSCWLQTLYYSSVGRQSHAHIIDHLKDRIGVHIADPGALLTLVGQAPTNKYLLSGYVEKMRGVPDADFGLVDIYGLALAARLLVPRGDLRINNYDLKISNQRFYTDDGQHPMPIYTAIRHEIPVTVSEAENTIKQASAPTEQRDPFQWFEWSPYELFCEELDAGIPTWAVGREWHAGKSVWRDNGLALPELRVPLMMGIWGSAFCATLSHYYKEVRPILKACGMGGLDTLLAGKSDDLVKVHPIDPAVIPNFALGLKDRLPESCPASIHDATHLQLMDAGMANNLPIYPLLRPGRDIDVIIAFDASADVRGDNWIKVVDGYARQRRIKGWPMGAGWPAQDQAEAEVVGQLDHAQQSIAADYAEIATSPATDASVAKQEGLSHCTVWAGSTLERQIDTENTTPCAQIDFAAADKAAHLSAATAGIAVIYFPFLANAAVPGVDPMKDEFMSTWNFVYSAQEIERVVALARANYEEGRERTRRTIRAVWERKRGVREGREREREGRWGGGNVGHGDLFGGV
ncbi:hypothetical protein LTR08_000193 [Meristemomyces frigidus]|nr:hypothetical protein LTR08_000193 [Meristemomyces frigidus]